MSSAADPDATAATVENHALSAMVSRLAGDHAALAARVTGLEDRTEDHAGALDDIERVLGEAAAQASVAAPPPTLPAEGGAGAPTAEDQQGAEVGLDMRRLVAWVRDNVALLLERKVPQTGGYPYWCRQWWMHPEAIARFEAARRSWTEAVAAGDGNAMVVYFEHLDHQLGVLCGENGPFCGCTGGNHKDASNARPLGQEDPDEGYFLEFEHAAYAPARSGNAG